MLKPSFAVINHQSFARSRRNNPNFHSNCLVSSVLDPHNRSIDQQCYDIGSLGTLSNPHLLNEYLESHHALNQGHAFHWNMCNAQEELNRHNRHNHTFQADTEPDGELQVLDNINESEEYNGAQSEIFPNLNDQVVGVDFNDLVVDEYNSLILQPEPQAPVLIADD